MLTGFGGATLNAMHVYRSDADSIPLFSQDAPLSAAGARAGAG